jgi:hypothetical protein
MEVIVMLDIGTGAIMLVMWSVVLVHIVRGNKNKWLAMTTTLLLLSNVAIIISGYADYLMILEAIHTSFTTFLFGASYGLFILMFNISHFLLAERYRKMAKTVPAVLDDKPEPVPSKCEVFKYWTLLSLNILIPIVYTVACVRY